MSATSISRHDSQQASSSRSWWQKNNKSQSVPVPTAHLKPASKFNTFASALGLKSKKQHPTLTIQEPPSPIRTVTAPSSVTDAHFPSYSNRPPSKSVSSIRSPVDSLEPTTPTDGQQHHIPGRQSLLTLSDLDPFAAHGIVVSPTSSDPSRLSALSNSSADYHWKKGHPPMPTRSSYGSISSAQGEPSSPGPATLPSQHRRLTTRRSHGSLSRKASLLPSETTLSSAWESLTHNALLGCTTSSADKNRRSQPPPNPLPRPPMRARGLTESGTRLPPTFLAGAAKPVNISPSLSESSPRRTSPSSPSVIRRKPSANRVGLPPSAPPTQELPLPPALKQTPHGVLPDDDSDILPDISNSSTSSSSLSFASSISSSKEDASHDIFAPSHADKKLRRLAFPDRRDVDLERLFDTSPMQDTPTGPPDRPAPFSSPQTLKKALSSQSLGKRRSSTSSTASGPPELPHDKAPRKQRSYPRIPMPPLPQSFRGTASVGAASTAYNAPTSTQRVGISSGLPAGRSRLFSGSSLRRPSTSQCTPGEADARSVFSLPLEHERLQSLSSTLTSNTTNSARSTTTASPPSHLASLWDDGIDEPGSPGGMSEFSAPRRILSPADMLKVEASVHRFEEPHLRSRAMSFSSMSTLMSEKDDTPSPPALSPPTSLIGLPVLAPHKGSPLRGASAAKKGLSPPRLAVRPSTSQATMTPPSTPSSPASPAGSSSQPWLPVSGAPLMVPVPAGLPPPPRPRRGRPTTAPHYSASSSQPSPTANQPVVTSPLASLPPVNQPLLSFALAPPPRKRVVPRVSADRLMQRKSILRKPSFLDIGDDESEREEEAVRADSFLDLARESFDTQFPCLSFKFKFLHPYMRIAVFLTHSVLKSTCDHHPHILQYLGWICFV
ncbi:hypothetical protein HGRIS_008191 [Hohenbuehelia grisea]|uniref:Uncharacterized protein n=1 Tax=Hohenbuehelia grisea TaxID=104357 RepID=A0ABR3J838_9AGAR